MDGEAPLGKVLADGQVTKHRSVHIHEATEDPLGLQNVELAVAGTAT